MRERERERDKLLERQKERDRQIEREREREGWPKYYEEKSKQLHPSFQGIQDIKFTKESILHFQVKKTAKQQISKQCVCCVLQYCTLPVGEMCFESK